MIKKPVPRNSRSKIPIRPECSPDREKSSRGCFRCIHIIENFGNRPRRCTFKCWRCDFVDPQVKYHQHQYKLPYEMDEGFPRDYIMRHQTVELNEMQVTILNQIGKLAGKLGISITKIHQNQ